MSSTPALDALAAGYALARVAPVGPAGDAVVRVSTSIGDLAVKSFGPAELDRAEREATLLACLAPPDPRFRVPTLVRTLDRAPLLRFDDRALVVTRWQPGRHKPYTQIDEGEWRALGLELAALHARLDAFDAPLPRLGELGARIDLAAERAGIEAARPRATAHQPARAAELDAYLDARLALLDRHGERGVRPPPGPEQAIHNDYNQHNYLFDGSLPPVILDWEGAIAAPAEYEVVRCLNHLPLVAASHARAFVAGYREARPLAPDAIAWAVDRALTEHATKHWPLDRWLAGLPGAERALTGSMEVVGALAARSGELAAFFAAEAGA